uniref:CCHC-type domain-containing protein n=1 Tax=Tanacetum cinerariifolium TaxID=118510 RepID=A0A699JDG0_TANCI|nr:hypothetical protein [Tanacetum cinerariifolium]
MSTTRIYTQETSGSNSGKQRTVICYNCKGEGHMSKHCTKPKWKQDDSWFKDKVLLVQVQANGQILHEKELAFLADPGITKAQVALMANLSHMVQMLSLRMMEGSRGVVGCGGNARKWRRWDSGK